MLLRIELVIPLLFGLLVALVGAALVFDAWTPDELVVPRERRRRPRAERDRGGEAMLGLGIIAVGAAFMGRDVWSYRIVAVIVGAVLMLLGAIKNRHLLKETISNRGKLRRGAPVDALPKVPDGNPDGAPPERLRIR